MKLTPWMLTVAAFAMVVAVAVGFLFKKLLARDIAPPPVVELRTLPMAISELEPGTLITRAHVGNGPWNASENLAPDTLTTVDGVIGRITRERITPATPLRGSMFYAPGDQPDLEVAEGKRAVTIRVSETTAVLNQKLKPGQHVDVQLTVDGVSGGQSRLQSTGSGAQPLADYGDAMTATLFKGVRLVSMNRSGSGAAGLQGGDSGSVTLELDENQARIALLAQQKGEIDLIYNPDGESSGGIEIHTEKDRVTLYELLGLQEREQQKTFRTEHFRGTGYSNSYFENGERIGGWSGDGGSGDGTRLQSNGTGDDWTTSTDAARRNGNVAQQPQKAVTDRQ